MIQMIGANQRFSQTYGVDSFSANYKCEHIKTILSCTIDHDWYLKHVKSKNALIHGDLEEYAYIEGLPST